MGCGASSAVAPESPPSIKRPLEDWGEQEVESWFEGLPQWAQQYKDRLLPDEGKTVAAWTQQYLEDSGIAKKDAARLLLLRDKVNNGGNSRYSSNASTPQGPQVTLTRVYAVNGLNGAIHTVEPVVDVVPTTAVTSAASSAGPTPNGEALGAPAADPTTAPSSAARPDVLVVEGAAADTADHHRAAAVAADQLAAPEAASDAAAAAAPAPAAEGAALPAVAQAAPTGGVAATTTTEQQGEPGGGAAGGPAGSAAHDGAPPAAAVAAAWAEALYNGDAPGSPPDYISDALVAAQWTLTEWLSKGADLALTAIALLGPRLPFPGDEAAALLAAVFGVVDSSVIVGNANLLELRGRAVALLDVLHAYQAALLQIRAYKEAVDDYIEVLQGVQSYCAAYASKDCIYRLATGLPDRRHYERLCEDMEVLRQRVALALEQPDGGGGQQQQPAAAALPPRLQPAVEWLQRPAGYVDPAEGLRTAVEAAGGLEAALADPDNLAVVLQQVALREDITFEMASSLLAASVDSGPQRHVRQPDLRAFWKAQYGTEAEVPWSTFWDSFPAKLQEGVHVDPAVVSALIELLAAAPAQAALQRALGRDAAGSVVTVYDVRTALSGDGGDDLAHQVQAALQMVVAAETGPRAAAAAAAARARGVAVAAPATASATATGRSAVSAANGNGDISNGTLDLSDLDDIPDYSSRGRITVPIPDAGYVGREVDCMDVCQQLLTRGSVVLVGAGGMGKSNLARDVAWRLHRKGALPGGALWVDLREARTAPDVEARLCAALAMERANGSNERRIINAISTLADEAPVGGSGTAPGGPTLLLVVDNAQDAMQSRSCAAEFTGLLAKVAACAPKARLLVASRESLGNKGGCKPFPERRVSPLSPAAAAQLVQAACRDLSHRQAETVATACRCVPLIAVLVSQALVSGRMDVEEVARMAKNGTYGDAGAASTGASGGGGGPSASSILRDLKPHHQKALVRMAVFPSSFDEDAAAAIIGTSRQEASCLVQVLLRHGLLQRTRTPAGGQRSTVALHAAVRQAAQDLAKEAYEPRVQQAAVLLYTKLVHGWLHQWAAMRQQQGTEAKVAVAMARDHLADVSCLQELLSSPERRQRAVGKEDDTLTAELLQAAASFLNEVQGRAAEAEPLYRQALDVRQALLGKRSAITASSMNELALCIQQQPGRNADAEPLFRQALERRRRLLGEHHPDTAASLNSLAACVKALGRYAEAEQLYRSAHELQQSLQGEAGGQEQPETAQRVHALAACINADGRYGQAEPLYRQALDIRQRLLGGDHPDTLQSLHDLAVCLSAQQRYDEAAALFRQALERQQGVLGDEHPDTLSSLDDLAMCLAAQGNYAEAEPLYRQALDLRRRQLGDGNAATLTSIDNLALCIVSQGEYGRAEALYREALELRKELHGEQHVLTALSLNNLAVCIKNQTRPDRYTEAEPLYRQALAIRRAVLGQEHPDTAQSINNLATCINDQGRFAEAEALYHQALELRRRILGEDHPNTVTTINNLAICVKAQGRYTEAEQLYNHALSLRMRLLGKHHPLTVESVNNLAVCLKAQHRYAEAEALFRQALESRQRLFGNENTDTASSMGNLASCLNVQGQCAKAEPLYCQALDVRRRLLGDDHPDTATSINNLANCYNSQGRYPEAEALYREALELRKRLLGKEHSDTVSSMANLAACLASIKRYREAEALYRTALEIRQRTLGDTNPATKNTRMGLDACLKALSKA